MTDLPPFQNAQARRLKARNRALSDEAIDWLVKLGVSEAESALRRDFEAWLARSPAHVAAANDAADMLAAIGQTQSAIQYSELRGVIHRSEKSSARERASRFTRRALMGGGMAAAAALMVGYSGVLGPVSGLLADHSTGVGERKRIELPDGSVMWLNTASAVSVNFSSELRQVKLHDGEALFETATEALRPFVVSSNTGRAIALAAHFSVRRHDGHTEVVVNEGSVNVRNGTGSARLAGGQMIRYGAGILGAVEGVNTQLVTAWHRGKLIFNRQALSEVITEIERYERGRIVIMDEALKDLRVSGVFALDDIEGALRTIADTVNARVTHLPLLRLIRPA